MDVTMTDATSPPVLPGLSSAQNALLTQLVTGPSIREVATHALQPALKALYPNLHIDPRLAMVVMPTWAYHNGRVEPGPRHFKSLTDTLVHHGVAGTPVIYLDGEHYLTLQPQEQTPVQLPVSIEAIGRLLNELAGAVQILARSMEHQGQPELGQRPTRHGRQTVRLPGKKRTPFQ